jgi:hypothetical protein
MWMVTNISWINILFGILLLYFCKYSLTRPAGKDRRVKIGIFIGFIYYREKNESDFIFWNAAAAPRCAL